MEGVQENEDEEGKVQEIISLSCFEWCKSPIQFMSTFLPSIPIMNNLHSHVFRCFAFVHIYSSHRAKLDPQVVKCIFIDYASNKKGYKCYHAESSISTSTQESLLKDENWIEAINEEMNALERNDTWETIERPRDKKACEKQNVIARSSVETEFRVIAQGARELLWMKIVLNDLKIKYEAPMKLFCNNKCATNIAHNPIRYERTKHIKID
ncbi:Copia protein, partial [Mucuna pruriens]